MFRLSGKSGHFTEVHRSYFKRRKTKMQDSKIVGKINDLEQAPIAIALSGMDERSVARMQTIFKVVYKDRCVLAPVEEASLAIIDLDGETEAWESFQHQFPDMPVIAMSESPSVAEGAIYIRKPAKLELLWKSISRLVAGLSPSDEITESCESPEALSIVADDSDTTTNVSLATDRSSGAEPLDVPGKTEDSFDPDDYFLGRLLTTLQDCAQKVCGIAVQCGEGQQLLLFPQHGRALTNLSDEQFRLFAEVGSSEKFSISIDADCDPDKGSLAAGETDGLKNISIDYLLWDLAQRTARGRVPAGTDLTAVHYLRCWPNFPRLPNTSQGMRITSLWTREPHTFDDIATSLGIEVTAVYSFYSAAFALGLAGPANRQVDGLIEARGDIKTDMLTPGVRNAILRHADNH